jgi:hypothetical protein
MIIIDYVYSPDDGGWYAMQNDLDNLRSRATRRIYPSRQTCEEAVERDGKTLWESWS